MHTCTSMSTVSNNQLVKDCLVEKREKKTKLQKLFTKTMWIMLHEEDFHVQHGHCAGYMEDTKNICEVVQ